MPIPSIDFSPMVDGDVARRQNLVREIRDACETYGFFELTGHSIPQSLLDEVIEQSKRFFSLPAETKEKYDKGLNNFNRGYERLRSQNFEKKTEGDLKEGYYFGLDLPLDHPQVVARKFNLGPNVYPKEVHDAAQFRRIIDEYFTSMLKLSETIFRILCETLEVDNSWVSEFVDTPIAILRLLHYPPQAPDASEWERGIGAHTDFGAITILLQDMVGGLQVWDRAEAQWTDVKPTPGAFVVNLGNLMMRWTNDRYLSNLHRVINKSGEDRYSIPFFFSGNPDFLVKCFSNCQDGEGKMKYPPVTVGEWISARYADTYGTSGEKAAGELSAEAAAASS